MMKMDFTDVDEFVSMFPDEIETLKNLMTWGCLKQSMKCDSCGDEMKIVLSMKKKVFRCNRNRCEKKEASCRSGSLFFGSKLPCRTIMKIARSWIQGESRDAAARSTKKNTETITRWYTNFREVVAGVLRTSEVKIGGPGVVVEVDETKLGKPKYHRGHRVEGVWVVFGLERTEERRAFCVQVPCRDGETLERIISTFVAEGSIVYTDGWKGYTGIASNCNVQHYTVNHSRFFKDPDTGICTNGVEGLNCALKESVLRQHRTEDRVSGCLAEFTWKRANKNRLCEAFIEALKINLEMFQ